MKTATARPFAFLAIILLAGCATPPHRARQYSAAYEALPEETQKRTRHGFIREGDTQEAVYIAMGPPQSREKVRDEIGVFEDHWIYLGRSAPGQDMLEQGNYQFITVNDVSWNSPFGASDNKRIHVVFIGNTVLRVDIEENEGTPLTHPAMQMPSP